MNPLDRRIKRDLITIIILLITIITLMIVKT